MDVEAKNCIDHVISLEVWNNSRRCVEETINRLLLEYLQLVLYLRSQIPEPVQLIQKKLQRKNNLSSMAANLIQKSKPNDHLHHNKCVELLKSLERISVCLNKLFHQSKDFDAMEALIVIGATPVSIKEVYPFKAKIDNKSMSPGAVNFERIATHARRFCMLMVQSPVCTGAALTLTSTRVFVKIPGLTAADGCTPWPNLRWSSKKNIVSAEVNFFPSSACCGVTDSLISSTDGLKIIDHNKENHMSAQKGRIPATDVQRSSNHLSSTSDDEKKEFSSKRVSTDEAFDTLLTSDDVPSKLNNNVVSKSDDYGSDDVPAVWLELPVTIKGFK